jgi:predicted dehydrogenase
MAGAGGRSRSLAASVLADERVELVAVHDPIPEARERFTREHGVDGACASFEELLERVDAVILVTPMPNHGPQSCAALARGIHVLSEVPAVVSYEQAHELVAAVRASDALYGLAENYCYKLPNLIVRELVRAGELGELYYGENDHLADMKGSFLDADGKRRWTADWWAGRDGNTYPTHSFGPLLQWFDDRVTAVSCVGAGRHEAPEHELQDTTVLLARTVRGALLRVRFSWLSTRPISAHQYGVQGTRGAYDGGDPFRGVQPAIHLHGRTPENAWEPLAGLAGRFLPERYRRAYDGGPLYPAQDAFASLFGPADAFMVEDFVDAVLAARPFAVDVYAGLDMTFPGLAAEASITQGGTWVHVPNPRRSPAGHGTGPLLEGRPGRQLEGGSR